jgi:hypothetical protein
MLTDPAERVRDAAFDLIDALTPPGDHVPRTGHVLCELFEQVAVGLQTIIDAPGTIIRELVGDTVAGSRVVAAAAQVLLKRAVTLAASGLFAPLTALHLKACALALALCPDESAHPSLDKNCVMPLLKAGADQN